MCCWLRFWSGIIGDRRTDSEPSSANRPRLQAERMSGFAAKHGLGNAGRHPQKKEAPRIPATMNTTPVAMGKTEYAIM
jgi:hypothetical protein